MAAGAALCRPLPQVPRRRWPRGPPPLPPPVMQADAELEAIRQRRMGELMGKQAPASAEDQAAQVEAKQAAEDQRRAMLLALLQPEARDRCESWGGAV